MFYFLHETLCYKVLASTIFKKGVGMSRIDKQCLLCTSGVPRFLPRNTGWQKVVYVLFYTGFKISLQWAHFLKE